MPGANYMGGKRNAAKARVKDTTGRLEKSFFGQRRLCAASQAMGRNNVTLKEGLGGANISLGHAKRKIPPNDGLKMSGFIPSPIDIFPSTPPSRRRKKRRIEEEHSSSSNVGGSKVLDALDVSEPMSLRQDLDKILAMPDLAGISRNQTKPTEGEVTVGEVRQPQALQRTERKGSASDLYEGSGPLSDDYNMELSGNEIHEDGLSEFVDDIQGDLRSSTSSSRDYRSSRYSSSPKPRGSNYTPYSNLNSSKITGWKESYPTSIVFRGLKNSSTKGTIMTATYPVEEPTVYGTLFEQADPWDTIGQILGLPNTKPSRSPEEVIDEFNEIDRSETSFETSSAVVETEERAQPSETGDEQLFIGNEYESVLGTPELEELDGHFLGPSLFELDKDEDEI